MSVFAVVGSSAGLYSTLDSLIEGPDFLLVVGLCFLCCLAWGYAALFFSGWFFHQLLFTFYMRQGYNEDAADKAIQVIKEGGRLPFAKRKEDNRAEQKRREKYEKLHKEFGSKEG